MSREVVRGYPGILGYPNISGFILWISPKKVPTFLFFNEGYPNIKFLTSSLSIITSKNWNYFYFDASKLYKFYSNQCIMCLGYFFSSLQQQWILFFLLEIPSYRYHYYSYKKWCDPTKTFKLCNKCKGNNRIYYTRL